MLELELFFDIITERQLALFHFKVASSTAKLTQSLPQPNSNLYLRNDLVLRTTLLITAPWHKQTEICPSFWTSCPFCMNTSYQYYKTLLNKVHSQKCSLPFTVFELNE